MCENTFNPIMQNEASYSTTILLDFDTLMMLG